MSGCAASGMEESDGSLETGRFRMPAGRFASRLAIYYAILPIAIMSVAIIACIITGLLMSPIDLRWIVGGLMLLFIAAPMLLAFLYISRGFSRGCFVNTLNHSIRFSQTCILVSVYPRYNEEGEEAPEAAEFQYSYRSVERIDAGGDAVTLRLGEHDKGFLWIPYAAFGDQEMLQSAMRRVHAGMKTNLKTDINNESAEE